MDASSIFRLGPDQTDIRKRRPYFLIPLVHPRLDKPLDLHADSPEEEARLASPDEMPNEMDENLTEETRRAYWRVAKYVRDADKKGTPVTDVFFVSHGWHRNFYGAVSAYDRIMSRVALLQETGRLKSQASNPQDADPPEIPPRFHPLYLTLHWHSDPGQNGWVDKCGRRHKAGFMKNALEVFETEPQPLMSLTYPAENFTKDFESLYEMMSQISAPGVDALSSEQIDRQCQRLSSIVTQYRIKDAPTMTDDKKVAIAWMCYHEALPKQLLLPQEQQPGDVIGFRQSIITLIKFLTGALGIAWVLGKLLSLNVSAVAGKILNRIALGMEGMPFISNNAITQAALIVCLLLILIVSVPKAKQWHKEWETETFETRAEAGNTNAATLSEVAARLSKQGLFQIVLAVFLMLGLITLIVNGDVYTLTDRVVTPINRVVAPLGTSLSQRVPKPVRDTLTATWRTLTGAKPETANTAREATNLPPTRKADTTHYLALYAAAFALGVLYLVGSSLHHQMNVGSRRSRGLPLLLVFSWFVVELPIALPITLFLAATYFFGWTMLGIGWVFAFIVRLLPKGNFLFDERLGQRDTEPKSGEPRGLFRLFVGKSASLPIYFLQKSLAEDSQVATLMDTINSQLAFYEMQRKGVLVGASAAQFAAELYNVRAEGETHGDTLLHRTRLHLLGHSFGGIVVVNLARHLVLQYDYPRPDNGELHLNKSNGKIDSLCLLEGALASNWFNGEKEMLKNIHVLACIYSLYDSANGFLYPLANRGRLAAGNVGLSRDLPSYSLPCYASLVRPPNIPEIPAWRRYVVTRKDVAKILNIDASRMIYEGSVAAGGGHDDIFKDEVVHLLWSVMRLTWTEPEINNSGAGKLPTAANPSQTATGPVGAQAVVSTTAMSGTPLVKNP